MEAPKCQRIPSCGKRHFGACGTVHEPKQGTAKIKGKSRRADAGDKELLARIESLESRVLELESRKKYMREYQRDRRSKGRDDG